jgi:hypothetical protein
VTTYPVEEASVVALSASGAGGGLLELEFTVTFGAVGAPTLVTNRPDLVASIVRGGVGSFAFTYSSEFATNERVVRLDRQFSGTYWEAVAYVSSDTLEDTFEVFDNAGVLTDPANGDRLHVTVRYTLDGSAF